LATVLLWILAFVLVIVGVLGTIVPMLPGTPLVFAGLLVAAWIDDFARVGTTPLVVLGVLTVLSLLVDFAASILGAKRAGATRGALTGAALGAVVGLFFGLPGLILGPFAGALAGQYLATRDFVQSGKAGVGTMVGLIAGGLAKLVLSIAMVAIFAVAYFS
jgi:uncharacterized protein YqgC (DUF456 family)